MVHGSISLPPTPSNDAHKLTQLTIHRNIVGILQAATCLYDPLSLPWLHVATCHANHAFWSSCWRGWPPPRVPLNRLLGILRQVWYTCRQPITTDIVFNDRKQTKQKHNHVRSEMKCDCEDCHLYSVCVCVCGIFVTCRCENYQRMWSGTGGRTKSFMVPGI